MRKSLPRINSWIADSRCMHTYRFVCDVCQREFNRLEVEEMELDNRRLAAENERIRLENESQRLKTEQENANLIQQFNQQKAQIQTLTEQVKQLTLDKPTTEWEQTKKVLTELVCNAQQRLNKTDQEHLETLLEAQQELTRTNNSFAQNQLTKAKNKLSSQLTSEQVQNLLHWQSKATKLEIEIAQINPEQRLEAQIEVAPPALSEIKI